MAELLKPKAAAERLAISVKTLHGHVSDGSIGFVITGRGKKRPRIAFKPSDIEEFEQERSSRRSQGKVASCRSTNRRKAPTSTTISGSTVIAFTALLAKRNAATQKR